jgi:hypothetical protein
MAHGWSTKIISMMKWIRTSRLSIKNSLSRRSQQAQSSRRDVHSLKVSLSHTRSLSLSFCLSLTHTLTHSISLSLSHARQLPALHARVMQSPPGARVGPSAGRLGLRFPRLRGPPRLERDFFINNLLVIIHSIIEMI